MNPDKTKNGEITPNHTIALAKPATPAGTGDTGLAESTGSAVRPEPAGEPVRSRQEKLAELKRLEIVLQEGLPHEDRIAAALAEIQTQKLYRLAGYRSFAHYVDHRLGFSRSRAYQLIAFHRATQRAQTQGAAPPANERQSRAQATGGDRSRPAREKLLAQTVRYVTKILAQLPPDQQPDFLAALGDLVRHWPHGAACLPAHPVVVLQAAAATCSASPPPPVVQSTAVSIGQPSAKGTTPPGDQVVPVHPALAVAAPPSQQPQIGSPPPGDGAARERPSVDFRGFSHAGMTMEEARRLGFLNPNRCDRR